MGRGEKWRVVRRDASLLWGVAGLAPLARQREIDKRRASNGDSYQLVASAEIGTRDESDCGCPRSTVRRPQTSYPS